jgi:membrane-associated phospholipid phosphatase
VKTETLAVRFWLVPAILVLLCVPRQAWCGNDHDSPEDYIATQASDLIGPLLIGGEFCLLSNGKAAKPQMIQGAKAVLATTVLAGALKGIVHEKRPQGTSLTSFPSGHTAAAFAMATVVADYKPRYKWLAYGAAAIEGWSRLDTGAHYWQDVAAGATLGYFTAKHFTSQHLGFSNGGLGYTWKW